MLRALFMAILLAVSVSAGSADELAKLGDEYIQAKSRFFPVWATSIGIHDFDTMLTDYSAQAIFAYRNSISNILYQLRQIDAEMLNADGYIDHKLLVANIRYDDFILARFPLHEHSPAVYVDEALNSLYFILLDKSRPDHEKAVALLARLRQIPGFLEQKWPSQPFMDKIFYEIAIESAQNSHQLLDEAAKFLYDVMPDSTRRIARYQNAARAALDDYATFCKVEISDAKTDHAIGKESYDYLLRNIHFLDISSDSLKKIGWTWYEKADAAMDSLQVIIDSTPPTARTDEVLNKSLTRDDILRYYQREIDETARFLKDHNIITIPDDIGPCIPMETPAFMQAMHRGIAYQPPPPLSSNQTGYLYIRPIPELDSIAINTYSNTIRAHGFRGGVVHEAYPGHHLQLSLAKRHPSRIRRIQDNTLLSEGWALYCEEMATRQGLFDDTDLPKRWFGVYGGVRFRAVRVIVDCSLSDGSMSPDSALVFMNSMLGDNTDYYRAEIRRYLTYPTVAMSYLMGKLLILDMLRKARALAGDSFDLCAFYDQLLAEGTIPPSLIAAKLGYK